MFHTVGQIKVFISSDHLTMCFIILQTILSTSTLYKHHSRPLNYITMAPMQYRSITIRGPHGVLKLRTMNLFSIQLH